MKGLLKLGYCLPALLVALAAGAGFRTTEPVLEKVVWPEKPIIEQAQEAEAVETELSVQEEPLPQPDQEETPQGVGSFEDGVYTGSGTGYSGTTTVRVQVKEGQIVSIDVTAHADKNPFWGKAVGVIDRVLTAQTWQVDTVSGATYSSRGILQAVKNAVTGSNERSEVPKKPKKPKKTPTESFDDTKKLKDGTWTGSARGFGGTIKVKVTVKGGKMTRIDVTSHSGESASYFKKAKKIIPRMIKKGSPNVDTVSGATYSSKGIREAVKKALKKAVKGKSEKTEDEEDEEQTDQEKLPAGAPQDGTYSGKGKCEQFDYSVALKAVFQDGKLQKLKDFELVSNQDRRNAAYAERAWEELSSFSCQLLAVCAFTVLFGRFFCGWACAFGALGDWVYRFSQFLQKKTGRKIPKLPENAIVRLQWGKFAVLVLILALCFSGRETLVGRYSPWTVFSLLRSGHFGLGDYWAGCIPLVLILGGMAVQERFFCQFLCPMGAVFTLLPNVPFFGLKRNSSGCPPSCGACRKNCPSALLLDAESHRQGECFRCGRCSGICPRGNLSTLSVLRGDELWMDGVKAAALLALVLLVNR